MTLPQYELFQSLSNLLKKRVAQHASDRALIQRRIPFNLRKFLIRKSISQLKSLSWLLILMFFSLFGESFLSFTTRSDPI